MAFPSQAPYGAGRIPPKSSGGCCTIQLLNGKPKLARRLAWRWISTAGRPRPVFAR